MNDLIGFVVFALIVYLVILGVEELKKLDKGPQQ